MTEARELQIELVQTQQWLMQTHQKVVIVFEGRDSAGKDGVIKRLIDVAHPRHTRVVALPRPNEREREQWYFQRYARHLPSGGELTIFNRSWYNRAGVEPVMGFCTPAEADQFLKDARRFEHMLCDSGLIFIKIWLDITKEEQAARLESRVEDPVKQFKLSQLDLHAQAKWDEYSAARDVMLSNTSSSFAPWIVIGTDRKNVARTQAMRYILHRLGRPGLTIQPPDPEIVFVADDMIGRLAP